jgi:hypothetical protein
MKRKYGFERLIAILLTIFPFAITRQASPASLERPARATSKMNEPMPSNIPTLRSALHWTPRQTNQSTTYASRSSTGLAETLPPVLKSTRCRKSPDQTSGKP